MGNMDRSVNSRRGYARRIGKIVAAISHVEDTRLWAPVLRRLGVILDARHRSRVQLDEIIARYVEGASSQADLLSELRSYSTAIDRLLSEKGDPSCGDESYAIAESARMAYDLERYFERFPLRQHTNIDQTVSKTKETRRKAV